MIIHALQNGTEFGNDLFFKKDFFIKKYICFAIFLHPKNVLVLHLLAHLIFNNLIFRFYKNNGFILFSTSAQLL